MVQFQIGPGRLGARDDTSFRRFDGLLADSSGMVAGSVTLLVLVLDDLSVLEPGLWWFAVESAEFVSVHRLGGPPFGALDDVVDWADNSGDEEWSSVVSLPFRTLVLVSARIKVEYPVSDFEIRAPDLNVVIVLTPLSGHIEMFPCNGMGFTHASLGLQHELVVAVGVGLLILGDTQDKVHRRSVLSVQNKEIW